MLNKRAQILFDEDLWNKLVKLSKTRDTSVGELVRNAIEKELEREKELEGRKKAVESTLIGRIVSSGKIDYKELVNYGRKF